MDWSGLRFLGRRRERDLANALAEKVLSETAPAAYGVLQPRHPAAGAGGPSLWRRAQTCTPGAVRTLQELQDRDLVGLPVALGAAPTLRVPWLRLVIRAYVEVWRALPNIITLFFVLLALPVLNLRFSAFAAATIGPSLWGSASVARIVCGAVQSIPAGQRQGATVLGLDLMPSNDLARNIVTLYTENTR